MYTHTIEYIQYTAVYTRLFTFTISLLHVKLDVSRYIMTTKKCGFVQKGPIFWRHKV